MAAQRWGPQPSNQMTAGIYFAPTLMTLETDGGSNCTGLLTWQCCERGYHQTGPTLYTTPLVLRLYRDSLIVETDGGYAIILYWATDIVVLRDRVRRDWTYTVHNTLSSTAI
jgi:hypothetical protein